MNHILTKITLCTSDKPYDLYVCDIRDKFLRATSLSLCEYLTPRVWSKANYRTIHYHITIILEDTSRQQDE